MHMLVMKNVINNTMYIMQENLRELYPTELHPKSHYKAFYFHQYFQYIFQLTYQGCNLQYFCRHPAYHLNIP